MKRLALVLLAVGCTADVSTDADSAELCHTGGCAIEYVGGLLSPLQKQMQCSETWNYFTNGGASERVAYCPDTRGNRARIVNSHLSYYGPGYCTDCLVVPDGQLLVVFATDPGPGCPSGCYPDG